MATHRYAIVGTGNRAGMYRSALTGEHADDGILVALADVNDGRLNLHADRAVESGFERPVTFHPDELEAVIRDHDVDRVIITSPDFTHAALVVRALRAGADVVVEKPLTIDAASARAISAAVAETGREVVMTFNYRYAPRNSALKRLIASGQIGTVTSVHFEWVLDTAHGADYFRRWHRDKNNSGGLLIHKASHHFDLVNWWIDDVPTRVFASGGLRFYGAENAAARGLGARPERGSVDGNESDPFALDLRRDDEMTLMYYDNERFDGYRRDLDVFSEGITIEDNLALVVDYAGGPSMSYSLNAHSPWEGYTIAVNGTEGRAELTVVERGSLADFGVIDPSAKPEESSDNDLRPESERLVLQRHWETARDVPIDSTGGGHGGGDELLLRDVFRGAGDDPLHRAADYRDGIKAISVGIAGNQSLATGLPVTVAELHLTAEDAEDATAEDAVA